jgi:hypothetical protein
MSSARFSPGTLPHLPAGQRQEFRPGSARNCGLPGGPAPGPARWCPARSLFLVSRVRALMRRRSPGSSAACW